MAVAIGELGGKLLGVGDGGLDVVLGRAGTHAVTIPCQYPSAAQNGDDAQRCLVHVALSDSSDLVRVSGGALASLLGRSLSRGGFVFAKDLNFATVGVHAVTG